MCHPADKWGSTQKWNQLNEPVSDLQATVQIISILMVHRGYIFKLWLQNWGSLLERASKNLTKSSYSQRSDLGSFFVIFANRPTGAGYRVNNLTEGHSNCIYFNESVTYFMDSFVGRVNPWRANINKSPHPSLPCPTSYKNKTRQQVLGSYDHRNFDIWSFRAQRSTVKRYLWPS